MSCDVGKATEGLESSFSNFSVTSPTSQLILQPFRRFTYVTAHSPIFPSLYLRHSSFSNSSVASPTSQLVLQRFFRFSYVTGSSLTSPSEPPMVYIKVKVSPLQAMKAHGGCGCKVPHIPLWWGRMASPTLGRFTPEEIPRYSFYRRLSGPQDQSGHEGVKKNLHPSDTRDRTRAVQPAA